MWPSLVRTHVIIEILKKDAIDDLVGQVLEISDVPDGVFVEAGNSTDNDYDNLQILLHNLSDLTTLHTHTSPNSDRTTQNS